MNKIYIIIGVIGLLSVIYLVTFGYFFITDLKKCRKLYLSKKILLLDWVLLVLALANTGVFIVCLRVIKEQLILFGK